MDPATTTAARDLARAASVPTGSTGSTGSADHDATGATALAAHLVPLTRDRLRQVLDDALAHRNALTSALAQLTFSGEAAFGADRPDWAVGPFAADPALTFTLDHQWDDPDGIGWTSSSLYNPTMIEHDGVLHLFYRASPVKESLGSRIGHATRDLTGTGTGTGTGSGSDAGTDTAVWVDDPANPVVRPTRDLELLGTEDPKVYRAEGRFWLFYNGIWPITEEARAAFPSTGYPVEAVGCDMMLAVSDDLVTWERLGPIADPEQTRLWAKGAVIPRDEHGDAVRVGGEYLMFVSEGFDGVLHVGHSHDMRTWRFEPTPYLDLSSVGGHLHEVAAAIVTGDGRLVLDVFHDDAEGRFAASQALYDVERPFDQLALTPGGSLCWGGLGRVDGRWTFAQGWDAPPGRRDLYVYREADGGGVDDPVDRPS
ncbi:putative GH43/DUF377 family glycosyl hydrolase [Frigoribacterium sp. PhB107]|uniref:hypothetical protein n=1 Tax=Frigoribacterium sp. PhB107 TaxID=2485172 RepID=UPI000F9A8B5E|nr:hypothetical protein [Frigoribacterium sp. PhB107]ROP75547.1 putative GH43/DUF377 family glycosyl hydrolase [Frigoribacterium sp. PhB107]